MFGAPQQQSPNIGQLLQLLMSSQGQGGQSGRPLPNPSPSFGPTALPQVTPSQAIFPGTLGPQAQQQSQGGGKGGGNPLSSLMSGMGKGSGGGAGKGGPNNANSDLIGEFTAPGNADALNAAFGSFGL
jgi:hypothetical protein